MLAAPVNVLFVSFSGKNLSWRKSGSLLLSATFKSLSRWDTTLWVYARVAHVGGGGFPTGFVQGCKGSQRRSPTVSMVVNVFFLSWGNREHVQNPFATKNLKKHRPWTSPDRNVAFTKYLFGAVLQGLATICHFLGTFETICQLPEMQANLVGSRNVKVHGPSPAVRLSKMTKKIEQKNS